jgi:hypothetical protein
VLRAEDGVAEGHESRADYWLATQVGGAVVTLGQLTTTLNRGILC